ncbi:UNVERIFIED_CONTAM: dockerin type I repeat protein [Acetivibrio alkalicellulosi]
MLKKIIEIPLKKVVSLVFVFLFVSLIIFQNSIPVFAKSDFEYRVTNRQVRITNYVGTSKEIVIPNSLGGYPVTSIGESAFRNKGLTSVMIPESVTSIESSAFRINNLTTVSIPDRVTSIGEWAFSGNQLTTVEIPDSVVAIGEWAFSGSLLTTVEIPDGVVTIGNSAFSNNKLTTVEISDSVVTIGNSAFSNNKLTTVEIPDSVVTIGEEAFRGNQLTTVTIGKSVVTIGESAFSNNQLITVEIPDSVITIGNSAFLWNQLTTVTIGESVVTIGNSAFLGNQLTTVTIGTSVVSIGERAFSASPDVGSNQNQLTTVILPDSVESIGRQAFNYNQIKTLKLNEGVITIGDQAFSHNQLTELNIPNSVTTIGSSAFYGNQLTELKIPDGVTTIGSSAFSNNQLTEVTISNSVAAIHMYTFSDNKLKTVKIPDGIVTIAQYAFDNNQLTQVTIPNSVVNIGARAFGRNQLTQVTIPNSVVSIGTAAFGGNQLTEVTIPDSVQSLSGFSNNRLTKVNIPYNVVTIEGHAFRDNQLTEVTIPDSVTTIGSEAFSNNQLTEVTIPDSVQSLSGFSNNRLTKLTIPDSVVTIGARAFENNRMTEVIIPDSVATIGGYAFERNRLTKVTIPDSVVRINDFAFGSNRLTKVTIPESVQYLSGFNNNQLTEVIIPESVVRIGTSAFSGNKLTSVTIPGSVEIINSFAFLGNQSNPANFTIKGYIDSTAHRHALSHDYSFKSLDFDDGIDMSEPMEIPDDVNYIFIADIESKRPIEGVKVEIGSKVFFTDEDGKVNLTDMVEGTYDINFSKDGYQEYRSRHNTRKGRFGVYYLKKAGLNNRLYVTSVFLNDNTGQHDVLKVSKDFKKINENQQVSSQDLTTIEITAKWNGAVPSKFVLFQDQSPYGYPLGYKNKRIESVDGIFRNVALGKEFMEGKPIYAYVISANGNSSKMEKTNLIVYSSPIKETAKFSISLGKETSFKIPENIPVLGGNTIKAPLDFIPAQIDVKNDRLRIAIGLDQFDFDKKWGDYKKKLNENLDVFELCKTLPKEFHSIKTSKPLIEQFKSNKVKVETWGYIEGALKGGKLDSVEGGIFIKVEFKASFQKQYVIHFIPVYVEVGGSIGLNLNSAISGYFIEDSRLQMRSGYEIIGKLSLGAGLGVVNVLTIGPEANLSISFKFDFIEKKYNDYDSLECELKVTGKGSGDIKAKALIFEYKHNFAEGMWQFYPEFGKLDKDGKLIRNDGGVQALGFEEMDLYDLDNYEIMSRDYIHNSTNWYGENDLISILSIMDESDDEIATQSISENDRELVILGTNIFPDARPLIHEIGDKRVMVWIDDNRNRSSVNRTMLLYSVYDLLNDRWSIPMAVEDDGTADFYPQLAGNKDNLYVVWQNSNKEFNNNITIEEVVASAEISVARFCTQSNQFTDVNKITENTNLGQTIPQIAAFDDQVYVTWVMNDSNDLLGTSGKNSIYYSKLTSGKFTKPDILVENLNAIAALNVGVIDDSFSVAYIVDTDNDLSTIDDRELYLVSNEKLSRKVSESSDIISQPIFGEFKNKQALLWFDGGNINYLTSINNKVEKLFDEPQGALSDNFRILSNKKGNTSVVWTSKQDESSQIYTMIYDNTLDVWSNPIKLINTEIISGNAEFILDDGGNYHVVYSGIVKHDNGTEASNLMLVKIEPSYDVEVEYVFFSHDEVVPDSEIALEIEVNNRGELKVDEFVVEILKGDSIINTVSVTKTLLPGESGIIDAKFRLPSKISKTDYTIKVIPKNKVDRDLSNNSKIITLGYTDLVLELERNTIDGNEIIIANIENKSYVPTGGIFRVREGSRDGKVIREVNIEKIEKGKNYSILLNIDQNMITYDEDEYKILYFEIEALEDEFYTNGNRGFEVIRKQEQIEDPIIIEPEIKYGDINGDNVINSTDAVLLRRYLLLIIEEFPNPNGRLAADINRDGQINSTDYILLRRYILGIINEL